jgi:hypothetical protein
VNFRSISRSIEKLEKPKKKVYKKYVSPRKSVKSRARSPSKERVPKNMREYKKLIKGKLSKSNLEKATKFMAKSNKKMIENRKDILKDVNCDSLDLSHFSKPEKNDNRNSIVHEKRKRKKSTKRNKLNTKKLIKVSSPIMDTGSSQTTRLYDQLKKEAVEKLKKDNEKDEVKKEKKRTKMVNFEGIIEDEDLDSRRRQFLTPEKKIKKKEEKQQKTDGNNKFIRIEEGQIYTGDSLSKKRSSPTKSTHLVKSPKRKLFGHLSQITSSNFYTPQKMKMINVFNNGEKQVRTSIKEKNQEKLIQKPSKFDVKL